MSASTAGGGKLLYVAKVHVTGGRERGWARSSDGRLDVKLSVPGGRGTGTNPEQLLAAAWAASFAGAIALVARERRISLVDLEIGAEVDLNLADGGDCFLRARLNVNLPALDHAVARDLVHAAHKVCPCSKALHGNVDVATTLAPDGRR